MTGAVDRGFGPPETFVVFLALVTALAVLLHAPDAVPRWGRLTGLGLALLGTGLHTWAWRTLRRAGTSVDKLEVPRTLVAGGAYARSRNPMYLAGVLIVSGWALAIACPTGVALGPIFGWLARRRWIDAEERLLAAEFGAEWDRYAGGVRRWL